MRSDLGLGRGHAVTLAATIVAGLALAACTAGAQGTLGPYCGKGDSSIPGRYTLQGVPEVGSELLMRADGSFEFYLAYGANDQYGKGCWTQNGRNIALFPTGATTLKADHTPDTRGFRGILLEKDGRDLVWNIPGWRYTGRYVK